MDKARPLVGIALTVLSALLLIGVLTFAAPCEERNAGMVGTCLWAGRAVLGASIVALLLSIVRIFERDEGERRGLDLGIALVGALVACMPGMLIDLCADPHMTCNVVLRPFCMGAGIAMALVGGADLVVRLLSLRKA